MKLRKTADYQYLQNMRGSAQAEWNWQTKESQERRSLNGSREERKNDLAADSNDQFVNLEDEILKVDKQLEQDGEFLFRQVGGKSSVKRRNTNQRTPSTHESIRSGKLEEDD